MVCVGAECVRAYRGGAGLPAGVPPLAIVQWSRLQNAATGGPARARHERMRGVVLGCGRVWVSVTGRMRCATVCADVRCHRAAELPATVCHAARMFFPHCFHAHERASGLHKQQEGCRAPGTLLLLPHERAERRHPAHAVAAMACTAHRLHAHTREGMRLSLCSGRVCIVFAASRGWLRAHAARILGSVCKAQPSAARWRLVLARVRAAVMLC